MPDRCIKLVGIWEVLSRRQRWREEQLDCLHMGATARLVRKGDIRYVEAKGNWSAACFSMMGCPVCIMLLVDCEVSFAFSLWVFRRVRRSCI